jgi:hypothetical protein
VDWSVRTDVTTHLDDFIEQAEAFFNYAPQKANELTIGGIRGNITRATGTLSTTVATLDRPTDFLEAYRFRITGDAGGLIDYVTPEAMTLKFRTGVGEPHYWTVSDVIELDVVADTAYAYELSYYPSFAALSDSNTTNWLITNHPNIYLSACLYHLNVYIQDYAVADRWMMQYKAGAEAVNTAYQRGRYSQGPITAQVA